jgi:regulator of sigma E protease
MPAYGLLQEGDRIVAINGIKIAYWDDMSDFIKKNADSELELDIERAGKRITVKITPSLSEAPNIFGEKTKVGLIGVAPKGEIQTVRYNPIESIYLAVTRTYDVTKLTILGIIKLVERVVPANNIGGPIMIFQMARDTARAGLNSLLVFTAVISINLAILNLLPIPILDGGHLLFYSIEAITRRPVSIKAREISQMVGLALILALTFFAFYNDIIRILRG